MEKFTIMQAAERWIAMIEAPTTKATPEAKAELIAKIRAAAPKVMVEILDRYQCLAGYKPADETFATSFVDATNRIKAEIRKAEAAK